MLVATRLCRLMMTIRQGTYTFFFLLLSLAGSVELLGQRSDFQSWWEFEFSKELTDKLDLKGELEQRFHNNSLQFSRSLLTLGLSYKPIEYFRVAGGARTILVVDGDQEVNFRYRIHLDAVGSYELSGFDLSLRVRGQYGFGELLALSHLDLNTIVNRNRLKVKRHIFGTKMDWFVSMESWHGANVASEWLTFALRYSAGLSYRFNFKSRLSLRYMLDDEFNVSNPWQLHMLVVGYSHNF